MQVGSCMHICCVRGHYCYAHLRSYRFGHTFGISPADQSSSFAAVHMFQGYVLHYMCRESMQHRSKSRCSVHIACAVHQYWPYNGWQSRHVHFRLVSSMLTQSCSPPWPWLINVPQHQTNAAPAFILARSSCHKLQCSQAHLGRGIGTPHA